MVSDKQLQPIHPFIYISLYKHEYFLSEKHCYYKVNSDFQNVVWSTIFASWKGANICLFHERDKICSTLGDLFEIWNHFIVAMYSYLVQLKTKTFFQLCSFDMRPTHTRPHRLWASLSNAQTFTSKSNSSQDGPLSKGVFAASSIHCWDIFESHSPGGLQ